MSTPIAPMSRIIRSDYIYDHGNTITLNQDSSFDINPQEIDNSVCFSPNGCSNYDQEAKNCQNKLQKALSPIKLNSIQQRKQNEQMLTQYYKMMKKYKQSQIQLQLERLSHQNTKRKMQATITNQQQQIQILKKTIFQTNSSFN